MQQFDRTGLSSRVTQCAIGAAYLELLVILPVLVLIAFGCIEFSNAIRTQQAMALLTREAGNRVFRQCSDLNDSSALSDCVEGAYNRVIAASGAALQLRSQDPSRNLDVILRLYKYDNACSGTACPTLQASWPASGNTVKPGINAASRFSNGDFLDTGGRFNQLLQSDRVVVTGEVFLAYKPVIPFIGRLFFASGSTSGGHLNEAVIF